MSDLPNRPLTILIAAIGGEGGGGIGPLATEGARLLLDWLDAAAELEGYPVQSTLLPGTTQRTGQTTYYLELYPARRDALEGREPVFRMSPRPGDVDVVIAFELAEAARAVQNGYVTPDRTTLVASTHRVYVTEEKIAPGDGRFDSTAAVQAAVARSRRTVMFDMTPICHESGASISAVMLGAIAASRALPISAESIERALTGTATAAERAGFQSGQALAATIGAPELPASGGAKRSRTLMGKAADLVARIEQEFAAPVQSVVREGLARVIDYQDLRYAIRYLDRLVPIHSTDREQRGGPDGVYRLTVETARYLALRMTFEDVIRVADLKTRASRWSRLRADLGVKPDEPVTITEYLKPGLPELASVLPAWLAKPMLQWARRHDLERRLHIGLHIRSTSIAGLTLLRLLASLRPLRTIGYGFSEEQRAIEQWLSAIQEAAVHHYGFAVEIARLSRLIKGYSDTHRRGEENYRRIFEDVVLASLRDPDLRQGVAERLRRLIVAALSDPEGRRLADEFAITVEKESRVVA